MKKNNDIPEPELFTSKIEETIDDLFKPVKEIEIDPLTQEIKEVEAKKPLEEQQEIELELAIEEAPEKKEAKEPAQEEQEAPVSQEEEPEPEIELELIDEEGTEVLSLDLQEETEEQPEKEDDISARLERLREDIYTLEWEVSGKELSDALNELKSVLDIPGIKAQEGISTLLALSARVLEMGAKAPEKMKATAPHTLKNAIETVINVHQSQNVDQAQVDKIIGELEELLGKAGAEMTPSATKPKHETSKEPPQEKAERRMTEAMETPAKRLSKEAEKVLVSHIRQLQKEVNKILPLERLLSSTPGMEKLYKFHKNLRSSLEREIRVLSQYFFEGIDLELPKATASEDKGSDYAPEIKPKGCPWKQLLTLSLEDMEIGIPAEQVVYMAQPPWLSKGFIKKAEAVPLSRLKPWPWSSLSSQFKGKLSEMDEKELGSLELPVIKKLDNTELPVPSSFYVIVIHDGEKGAILRTKESPISINVPQNAKCQFSDSGSFAGKVEVNGNKINVITAESVSR